MEGMDLDRRIQKALIDGLGEPQDGNCIGRLGSSFFRREEDTSTRRKSVTKIYLKRQRDAQMEKICRRLFDATQHTDGHFERLDQIFTELSTFSVHQRVGQTVQHVTENVRDFLGRFPEQPLGLPGVADLPDCYFCDDHFVEGRRTYTWPCLKVTSNYSTSVLKVVLFRVIYGTEGTEGDEEKNFVDLTADLLDTCCNLESKHRLKDKVERDRWLIVRTFLWASWQRLQMLYFFRKLYYSHAHGIDTELGSLTVLRSTFIAPGMTIQRFSDQIAFEGKPAYMCSWAFNLLRTDGIAIGSDFRHFHNRYIDLHGELPGRCKTQEVDSCDGDQLGNCERHNLNTEDQSMHNGGCPRNKSCTKVCWDEASYRSVNGGRAINICAKDYHSNLLKYKKASNSTLAISHAWAHGQGGRPDTGINLCLHMRYLRLAESLGCDSYFLDTVCIPGDHELRTEAIRHINETFSRSKVTLVVDRDLLEVDISNLGMELRESILATILVGDWNVRGWTLLEAMKGRRNIHLLCKDEKTVNYSEMIEALVGSGRLDITIFALLAPHLLSWTSDNMEKKDEVGVSNPGIEEAGTLLSYRPASRSGDDIVIWSLMINRVDELANNAEDLWRSRVRKGVKTGYLISSAERLDEKGLSWAPATPYAAPKDHSIPVERSKDSRFVKRFYRAFPGEETEDAEIEESGIFADWYVHEFDAPLLRGWWTKFLGRARDLVGCDTSNRNRIQQELADINSHFLNGYHYGALLQAKVAGKPQKWSMHNHIATYSGGTNGTLLVVLGSATSESTRHVRLAGQQSRKWVWRGVRAWPSEVPLPKFKERRLWIA